MDEGCSSRNYFSLLRKAVELFFFIIYRLVYIFHSSASLHSPVSVWGVLSRKGVKNTQGYGGGRDRRKLMPGKHERKQNQAWFSRTSTEAKATKCQCPDMSVLGNQKQVEMCETLERYNLDLEQCFPYGAYVPVGCPDYKLTTQ